jgi:hypothetical protein
MRLSELIERLEELRDDLADGVGDEIDPVVVAAYQESFPLSGTIQGAVVLQDDEDDEPVLCDGEPVVWLAIGGHPHGMSPYAPRAVFEAVP